LTEKTLLELGLSSSVGIYPVDSCLCPHNLQMLADPDHHSAADSPIDFVVYQKVAEDMEEKDPQTRVEAYHQA
jgi:hypothetical protein